MSKQLRAVCGCCFPDKEAADERKPLVRDTAPAGRTQPPPNAAPPAASGGLTASEGAKKCATAKWNASTFQAIVAELGGAADESVPLGKVAHLASTVAVVGPPQSGKSYMMLAATPDADGVPRLPEFRRASGFGVRLGGAPNAAWLRAAATSDPVLDAFLHRFGDSIVIVAHCCDDAVEFASRADALKRSHTRFCVVHNYVTGELPSSLTDKPVVDVQAAFKQQNLGPWSFSDDAGDARAESSGGGDKYVALRSRDGMWTHLFLVRHPSRPSEGSTSTSTMSGPQARDSHNFAVNAPAIRAIQQTVGGTVPMRVDREVVRALNDTMCDVAEAALSLHEDARCSGEGPAAGTGGHASHEGPRATGGQHLAGSAAPSSLPDHDSKSVSESAAESEGAHQCPSQDHDATDERASVAATTSATAAAVSVAASGEVAVADPTVLSPDHAFFRLDQNGRMTAVDTAWESLASALSLQPDRLSAQIGIILGLARAGPPSTGDSRAVLLLRRVPLMWSVVSWDAAGPVDDGEASRAEEQGDAADVDVETTPRSETAGGTSDLDLDEGQHAYACRFTMDGLECPTRRAIVVAQLTWGRGLRLRERAGTGGATVEFHVRGPHRQIVAQTTIVELSHVGGVMKDPKVRFEPPATLRVQFPPGDIQTEPDEEGQLVAA